MVVKMIVEEVGMIDGGEDRFLSSRESSDVDDMPLASCSLMPQHQQEQQEVIYSDTIPASLMELIAVQQQQQRFAPFIPPVSDLKKKELHQPTVPSVPTPVIVESTKNDQDQKEEQHCCIRTWVNDFDWMTDKEFMDQIFPNIITELINPDQPSPSPIPPKQQLNQPPPQQEQLAVHRLPDAAGSPPDQDLSLDGSDIRKGAWTEDEHRRFLEGQALYPNKWKKISSDFVRTRTGTQIASHNQTFELGLATSGRKRGRKSSKNPTG